MARVLGIGTECILIPEDQEGYLGLALDRGLAGDPPFYAVVLLYLL